MKKGAAHAKLSNFLNYAADRPPRSSALDSLLQAKNCQF
jgi:hypothetical protein